MTTAPPLSPVRRLVDALALDRTADDEFRSRPGGPTGAPAVFGGHLVAQALAAAAGTVPTGREPHSLHGYFLFRADPDAPLTYRVERLRDGHTFSSRRVVAVQRTGRTPREVFHLTASFKSASRPGPNHQVTMATAPAPHRLRPATEAAPPQVHPGVIRLLSDVRDAVDVRYVDESSGAGPGAGGRGPGTTTRVWFRIRELPPGAEAGLPALHQSLVAYLSDLTLLDSASPHHHTGRSNDGKGIAVSLDHAMWFHRPLRADEWLLYEQRSPSYADGRALAHASVYTADGTLAASVVQEGVIRPGRGRSAEPVGPFLDDTDIDPFSWVVAKPETD
ncbi:acyl-CoA thioesterase [Streptomyces sp. JNUCC 64]